MILCRIFKKMYKIIFFIPDLSNISYKIKDFLKQIMILYQFFKYLKTTKHIRFIKKIGCINFVFY